jgi:hypothetical protein
MIFIFLILFLSFSGCFQTILLAQPIWKDLDGVLGLSAPTAKRLENLIGSLIVHTFFVVVSAKSILG